jgi:hypothetical protein
MRFWGVTDLVTNHPFQSGIDSDQWQRLLTDSFGQKSGNGLHLGADRGNTQSRFLDSSRAAGYSGSVPMGFAGEIPSRSPSHPSAIQGGAWELTEHPDDEAWQGRISSRDPISEPVPEPFTVVGTVLGSVAAWRLRKQLQQPASLTQVIEQQSDPQSRSGPTDLG